MSQIYGMKLPINTARAQIVWGSHKSMTKWGSLTLAQLTQTFFSLSVIGDPSQH